MNIAIVDDDKDILELLEKFLKKQGHSVRIYINPVTALSSISKDTDVVLSDITMPQMSGLELLEKLSQSKPDVKVIIMTGDSTLDKVLKAHRNGAVSYIMKPFKSMKLLEEKIIKMTR